MERITEPQEDLFHKYPVLKIPTGKPGELLIIGLTKARAVIKYFRAIEDFVNRHSGHSEEGKTDDP